LGPLAATRQIAIDETTTWTQAAGTLSASADWGEDARVHVTGNLTIAPAATLTIGAGSIIKLAAGATVRVEGSVRVNGAQDRPVVFTPGRRSEPWGGFVCVGASTRVTMTFAVLTGSGADPRWFDNNSGYGGSHKREQPCLYLGSGVQAQLTDCYLVHSAGQAGHGEGASLTMTRCLVQRHTTTGQYNEGSVTMNQTALIEFPAADVPWVDGDNDGMYLTGGAHALTDCLIGWTLDDGVDAGGGSGVMSFTRCWFESTYHEGFALSTSNRRYLDGCVTLNCGQGIECGYGSLRVEADGCFSTANAVGVRFGDCYDWDYDGFLTVTDSLILFNKRDIWGRAWDTWEHHLDQMDFRDNLLSAADPLHPANGVWDPATDAARLAPFLPVPDDMVGIGFALRSDVLDLDALSAVPVRLSSFSRKAVAVDWRAEAAGETLASGTLSFEPGRTVLAVPLEPALLAGASLVRLVLEAPVNAELTGIRELTLVRSVVLVPRGSVWRYRADGTDQGTAWRGVAFDDGGWPAGPAQLGFDEGDEATRIPGGPSNNRYPTVYFRHEFDIDDPAAYDRLQFKLLRDDGAVVHVNGEEAFRSNMPPGEVSYTIWASDAASDEEEDAFFSYEVDAGFLRAGTNVIAVEIHQATATSSDLSFDLECLATPSVEREPRFVRADPNGDGRTDLSDAIATLQCLFSGRQLPCVSAADVNDDGKAEIADPIALLGYLFSSGAPPPPPFGACGVDPTPDELPCEPAGACAR
jgi:hypothetical protein